MQKTDSGFLYIYKPADWTSHDVIAHLRKITGIRTIGHAGTLDPFATGLLIVGVGRPATKRLSEFQKQDKIYEAVARFDGSTNTDDITGVEKKFTPTPTSRVPSEEKIQNAFAKQKGQIKQVPPMYSAKKIAGKKLYELARKGKTIERKPVQVTIKEIDISEINWPDVKFTVSCSTGTYVRAIARDIGIMLGTGGYLTELRRTAIGDIFIDQAVALSDISRDNWSQFIHKH